MTDISPYRRAPHGDISDKLGRWLEELRRKVNQSGGNVQTPVAVGDSLYLVRSVDLTRANSAVSVADPDFTRTLPVNSAWALEGVLKFTGTTGGFRFNLSGPADGTFHWAVTDPTSNATTENNNGMLDDVRVATTTGSMSVHIGGVFRTGANAFPFQLNWGQDTAGATGMRLDQGSWLRLTRVTGAAITPPTPVTLTINPATISGIINIPISVQLTTTGGTAPYAYSLQSGSLPPGLTLSPSGLISGTPTSLGTYNYTVASVDGSAGFGTRAYTTVIGAGNAFVTTLNATNPYAYWLANEATGSYANGGNGGVLPLNYGQFAGATPAPTPLRPAPGLIRQPPNVYGFHHNHTNAQTYWHGDGNPANGPDPENFNTGGFGAFFVRFNGSSACTIVSQHFRSSTNFGQSGSCRLSIDSSGRLVCALGAQDSGTPGQRQQRVRTTATNLFTNGQPYFVAAIQRGDGVGIRLYINGVEQAVTRTFGNLASENTFIHEAMFQQSQTLRGPFTVNGRITGGNPSSINTSERFQGITCMPMMWRNAAPTAQQITDLWNNSLVRGAVTDWYEHILENHVYNNHAMYLAPNLQIIASETAEMGNYADLSGGRITWTNVRGPTNVANPNPALPQSRFAKPITSTPGTPGGQFGLTAGVGSASNDTVGTMMYLITLPSSLAVDQVEPFWTYGEGTARNDRNVGALLSGNSFGTSLIFRIGTYSQSGALTQSPSNYWQTVWAASLVGLTPSDFPATKMFHFVQDGTTIRVYVNGQELAAGVVSSGGSGGTGATPYGANGWFGRLNDVQYGIGNVSSPDWQVFGYPSDTSYVLNSNIRAYMYTRRAMSAAEVLADWNAANGSF